MLRADLSVWTIPGDLLGQVRRRGGKIFPDVHADDIVICHLLTS